MNAPREGKTFPARLARWMVERCLPVEEREFFLGDLEEIYRSRVRPSRSCWRADLWYGRQCLIGIFHVRRRGDRPAHPVRKGDGQMGQLKQDLQFALRMFARNPGFTAVAVAALVLGIGANTAMFSIVHGVLIRPLPFPEPDQIVLINEQNLPKGWESFSVAPPNFMDWRDQNRSFSRLAAFSVQPYNYTGGAEPERLRGLTATEGFLEILGGTPSLGRGFLADEFEGGKDRVVILGYGAWQKNFAADPGVLGKQVLLNGEGYTVVGVMHPNWRFAGEVDLFTPRSFSADSYSARGAHYLNVVARLKDGAPLEAAQAEMTAIAGRLGEQYPETNRGWGVVVTFLQEAATGDIRLPLLILLGAVGLVLLIACANVANMQLARASVRSREIAVRTAMGASRWRLVRQLLTESLLLALIGGGLGLLLAAWGVRSLLAANPNLVPRGSEIGLNPAVAGFTLLLSAITGLVSGVAPAISTAASNLSEALKQGTPGRASGHLKRRLRGLLVVAEMALALMLLIGSGLLLRSFAQLRSVDPGFRTDSGLTLTAVLPRARYPEPHQQAAFFEQARQRLAALPGVESAAVSSMVPLSGIDEMYSVDVEGVGEVDPAQRPSALYYLISAEYFQIMGIPILSGRGFTDSDREGTARVVLIDEHFAKTILAGRDPIGQRVRLGRDGRTVREIVGVVAGVKHYGLGDRDWPQVYEPFAQMPKTGMSFVLRTTVDPLSLVHAARKAIQSVDKDQPVVYVQSLEQMVADSVAMPRFRTLLLGIFGGMAMLLAAVGLYGVMSYTVTQRTQEIGIRMALGARPGTVVGMVLREGMLLAGAGLVLGLAGALALSRVLQNLVFGISVRDLATFVAVPLVLALVAFVATLLPARRATAVDPIRALRCE